MADTAPVAMLNALATYLAGEITTDNGYSFDATDKVFVGKQRISLEAANTLPVWVLFGMSANWDARSINSRCIIETIEVAVEAHAAAEDIDDAHITALNIVSETGLAIRRAPNDLNGTAHDVIVDGANWEVFFNEEYQTVVAVITFQVLIHYSS